MTNTYERDLFKEAHTLLKNQGYRNYIVNLLPAGKWKNGEYIVKNPTRNDDEAGSFSINENGKWYDYNDATIREVLSNKVIGNKNYCLIYRLK